MSGPNQSRWYRLAVRVVTRWCEFYTRDLDPKIAEERRNELASDLHEEGASATGSGLGLGASVATRAIAGAPADLSWRRSERRVADREAGRDFAARWQRDGAVTATAVLGTAMLAWGLFALVRLGIGALNDYGVPYSDFLPMMLGSVVADACGLVLLSRARTRSLGALWLAAASYGLVNTATRSLFYTSATISSIYYANFANMGLADAAVRVAVVCVGLFFLTNAVLWFALRSRKQRPTSMTTGGIS
ncbi:MAG: hypothetical protein ABJB03_04765 [Rhodoglobus sp.]